MTKADIIAEKIFQKIREWDSVGNEIDFDRYRKSIQNIRFSNNDVKRITKDMERKGFIKMRKGRTNRKPKILIRWF